MYQAFSLFTRNLIPLIKQWRLSYTASVLFVVVWGLLVGHLLVWVGAWFVGLLTAHMLRFMASASSVLEQYELHQIRHVWEAEHDQEEQ